MRQAGEDKTNPKPEADLTPPVRFRLIKVHALALAGTFLPAGEFLLPYYFLRRQKTIDLESAEHLGFQLSWLTYRLTVLFLTVATMWLSSPAAQIKGSPPPPDSEAHIVGETERPAPPTSLLSPQQQRAQARERREWVSAHRTELLDQALKMPEMANLYLEAAVGLGLFCSLWLGGLIATNVALLSLLRNQRPKYPLTLPWLRRRFEKK